MCLKGLRTFMSILCPNSNAVTIRSFHRILSESQTAVKNELITSLSSIKYLSLTVDLWTDRQLRSFMGVTVHFFDSNYELKTNVLACKLFEGRNSGENLKKELDQMIDFYNIR